MSAPACSPAARCAIASIPASGLSVIEVTKICFVAGLTFWLGNATVLGLGILDAPQAARALDQLPLWANRVIALVILALLGAYVAWVWVKPRVIGRDGWQVNLPGGPLTLVQIAIGIVDLACCAAAMYMLVPDDPHVGFVTVAVIFVAATLLGFASHAPGGLGVFDAAMLVALWQFDKEDLLAGLLLFRLLYYIIPFVLALGVLAAREVLLSRAARRLQAKCAAWHASPPEIAKARIAEGHRIKKEAGFSSGLRSGLNCELSSLGALSSTRFSRRREFPWTNASRSA